MNATTAPQGAEERFGEIYAEHARRVTQWLHWHLPESIRGRAEDLAQEVFLDLWVMLRKGREITHPFALLKRIAQRRIADQFAVRARDAEAHLMDVTDTEAPTVETVGCSSRYAADEPELALIAAELDTAMERMHEASAAWRDLHAKAGRLTAGAQRAVGRSTKTFGELAAVHASRDEALTELQETCRVVGQLRAELEQAGGEGWKSSGGWPPSAARDGRKRCGALSDPAVKVCPKQHCLADVDSVGFLEDGTRVCRSCSADATKAARQRSAVPA